MSVSRVARSGDSPDTFRSRRDVHPGELATDLAHEAGVLGHLLHQPVALGRRLGQAVDARLYLRGRSLLAPCGDEERDGEPCAAHKATAIAGHLSQPPARTGVT